MRIACVVVACTLSASAWSASPSAAQKPVETLIGRPNYMPGPASTEILWQWADAVVSGRVVRGAVHERFVRPGKPDPYPALATDYLLHVSEVLKQSEEHKIIGNVKVRFPGGEKEYADKILVYQEEGCPLLEADAMAILFLRWSSAEGIFIPLYGPEGIYVESDEVIQSPSLSRLARANSGRSVAEFNAELKAIRQKHDGRPRRPSLAGASADQ